MAFEGGLSGCQATAGQPSWISGGIFVKRLLSTISFVLLSGTAVVSTAHAQDADSSDKKKTKQEQAPAPKPERFGNSPVFQLGEIVVYGGSAAGKSSDIGGQSVSQSTVTAADIHKTNRNTLDDALATTPGVSSAATGTGSRNERTIYVRGFDRFQVPLYIDGVRVYLPADNRLDYGRFLTPDLSEIQVQKGYASVLSGPGGMGGAINLVTRKPTKEFEGELRTGVDLGNTGELAAFTTSGWVGTKQENYYLQASGSFRNSDGWFLPESFSPASLLNVYDKNGVFKGTVPNASPVEDGGRRDFSKMKDWRGTIKAGITPNDTDEYAISYTKQRGSKDAPYSVFEPVRGITTAPLPSGGNYQRNWSWPQWDIGSLAFNSNTAIGEQSYVKSKVYYNSFDNLLRAFDDATYSSQARTSNPQAFDSYYKDHAAGFSLEAGTDLIEKNTLKTALHFRRDVHNERQDVAPDSVSPVHEPWQATTEDTWSVAVEDTFHATEKLDLVAGASYDTYRIGKAEEYNTTKGLYENPLSSADAFNWQAAAIYRQSETSEFHASVSSRTRFPTLFELYSTRFGDAVANPDLKPERATNYEIGWTGRPTDTLSIGGSVFYSDLTDVIQSVNVGSAVQNQNVGDGHYYGTEIYGEWAVLPELTLGANYTYLKRHLDDPARPNIEPAGTPEHSAYLYADWMPYENLTVSPNVALYSSRWSADRLESNFFNLKGFALANINVNYKFNEKVEFDVGVRNIFDANYQLAYGFPEPGRTFYLSSAVRF